MLGMDHLSDLDPKDFKAMEGDKEQAVVKALKLIHNEEQTQPEDKGKEKVDIQIQLV